MPSDDTLSLLVGETFGFVKLIHPKAFYLGHRMLGSTERQERNGYKRSNR